MEKINKKLNLQKNASFNEFTQNILRHKSLTPYDIFDLIFLKNIFIL